MSSTNDIEEMKQLEHTLLAAAAYMTSQSKHEDAAIFIGSTRSGKSSLINYVIGNKLIGEKVSLCKPIALKKGDNSPGPQIGIGSTSETIIPSRWDSTKLSNLGIWDAPGFDDNRGAIQDIANAFYVTELFKNIKSARIVLVTDINDIANDSIRPFLSLLEAVESIFKEEMSKCFSSIAIIFSKVPNTLYDTPVDKNFINELLKQQFLLGKAIQITETSKELIKYFISNNQNIGIFKRAIVGNVSESDIDEGIIEAIKETKGLQDNILKKVSPSIAHSSKVFLFRVREKLSCMEAFIELQKLVAIIFEEKLTELKNIKNDELTNENLIEFAQNVSIIGDKISNILDTMITFEQKIAALQTIDSRLGKLIKDYNLNQKAKFMTFIDQLLNLKESKQFYLSLQSMMTTAKTKVDELNIWIRFQLGEINQREALAQAKKAKEEYENEFQELKREMKQVKKHNDEVKESLGFFATVGSFLDSGIDQISKGIANVWNKLF